tara:strand:- start:549 stop:662 length:114 start_codon:yes stop_codon:yes gene_type:complete
MNRAEKLMLVIEGLVKSLNNQVDKKRGKYDYDNFKNN